MSTPTCWKIVERCVVRYESMNASCPPQSQRLRMRSPRKRTWFCSTSMVAPRREVSDAGLFELQAYVLSAQRRGLSPPGSRLPARARERDAQDEGAHGGLPAPRCTHQKDLKEVSETFGGNEARRGVLSSSFWRIGIKLSRWQAALALAPLGMGM